MKRSQNNSADKIKNLTAPYTAKDLLELRIKNIPYLIDTILPLGSLCFLYGSSGTGKSSLLRQMALAIAGGAEQFLGFDVMNHGKVVMLSTEDGVEAISMYLNKVEKRLGVPVTENLVFFDDPNTFLKNLTMLSDQHDIKAVFVDCYSDAFDGHSGNDASDARKFLKKYDRLAKKYGYPIIFLHHVPKSAANREASKNNMIGSQGNQAKARVAIELREDGLGVRTLHFTKGNYMSDQQMAKVYYLKFDDMLFTLDQTRQIFKEKKDGYKLKIEKRVRELREQNLSWAQISETLKSEGFENGTSKSYINQKYGNAAETSVHPLT